MRIGGQSGRSKDERMEFFRRNGIDHDLVYSALLSHSADVAEVGKDSPFLLAGVDSLTTAEKNTFLSVTVADCYPVFFYDCRRKIAGLAHAGWRGISGGIIANTIYSIKKLGGDPENIFVSIGPGIGRDHFEFGLADAQKFFPEYLDEKYMSPGKNGKIFMDLPSIIADQLGKSGVDKKNIEISGECTFCQKEYFSFRRDRSDPLEAMMAVIGMK